MDDSREKKENALNLKIRDLLFTALEQAGVNSNYQIWKKTGIDQSLLSKIKRGKENLSMGIFIKICQAFSLDVYIKTKRKKRVVKDAC